MKKNIYGGGSKTNINGKLYENETNIEDKLYAIGFNKIIINKTKYGYYLVKKIQNTKVIYLIQNGCKIYCKIKYNIDLFRIPDEMYIIKRKKKKDIIKIIEKKTQHCEGSVETKLWASPSLKREYEILFGDSFSIKYGLSVNEYLTNKVKSKSIKYVILMKILKENKIKIFHGNSKKYYVRLLYWINNLLL
jgi:hypothetical protein